jgi:hypothetical protein
MGCHFFSKKKKCVCVCVYTMRHSFSKKEKETSVALDEEMANECDTLFFQHNSIIITLLNELQHPTDRIVREIL